MVATTWRERDNALSNFDSVTGKLVIPSDKLPPQGQERLFNAYPITLAPGVPAYQSDRNNFAPRLGFAWRPAGMTKTVVRGGAGVYFNPLQVFIGVRPLNFSNFPFALSESFDAVAGPTPTLTMATPFAGSATITANPAITGIEPNLKNNESYQWNFTIEREVAKISASAHPMWATTRRIFITTAVSSTILSSRRRAIFSRAGPISRGDRSLGLLPAAIPPFINCSSKQCNAWPAA